MNKILIITVFVLMRIPFLNGQLSNDTIKMNLLTRNADSKLYRLKTHDFIVRFSASPFLALFSFHNYHVSCEFTFSHSFSACFQYTPYNDMGYILSTGLRYYFENKSPSGIYLDCKLLYGRFSYGFSYLGPPIGDVMEQGETQVNALQSFSTVGLSILFGDQLELFKHCFFDFNFGVQYLPLKISSTVIINGQTYTSQEGFDFITGPGNHLEWYLLGPGNILTCNIGLGFKF